MNTIDVQVLDKSKDAEQRKSMLISLADCDSTQAFDLTLQAYRTIDTKHTFKGYQQKVHLKQNTEFLLFRDTLRQNVYKHYVSNKMDCLSKLKILLDEKSLNDVVRNELDDIWRGLRGDTVVECVDVPERDVSIAEYVCRREGISLDEFIVEALADYIATHKKEK